MPMDRQLSDVDGSTSGRANFCRMSILLAAYPGANVQPQWEKADVFEINGDDDEIAMKQTVVNHPPWLFEQK